MTSTLRALDAPVPLAADVPFAGLQNAGIAGVGMCVPDRIVTNDELAQTVDTNDEWIVARTGIRARRIADADTATSDLAFVAAQRALEDAGLRADELDLVLCATTTGDYLWPATACVVQQRLGATRAAAFDLSAACSASATAWRRLPGLFSQARCDAF